jgi:predicted nucleotidyltransferase
MGSTESDHSGFSSPLFGKTRRAILALLFSRPGEDFYLRQIVRLVRSGQGGVQRELQRLAGGSLISRRVRGRTTFYQANRASPVFDELHRLIIKTAGVAEVLRTALSALEEHIDVAFIYGSVAGARVRAASDIDLFVVGAVGFDDIVDRLSGAQTQLGREVNPTVFDPQEFKQRIARKDHFVAAVINGPKVFLIGGPHDLDQLAHRKLVDRT